MPRGEHYLDGNFVKGKGYTGTSLSAEEATGIGILIVVLAVLLILGCWYCKRHNGYKKLLVPNAPPAYEKSSSSLLPPPYAP
ncbi:melanoma antigen recognized by T-cells 1 [Erythrolamprus reginae]|uniref:melanoma antigen recognized by T-cells 1 n=1 Tax=Erythrolamprus reginae TaxID=121349 RepID=UPI00396CFDC3